jgi:HK97 gp10 family phage protein
MARKVVTTEVLGLRELGERFKMLSAEVQNKLSKSATGAAARLVRDDARRNHAFNNRTGELEKGIGVRRVAKLSYPGMEIWSVGVFGGDVRFYADTDSNRRKGRVGWNFKKSYETDPPGYYWKFVEYGTVKMEARPFLNPALERNVDKAISKMAATLDKGLALAVRRMPPQTRGRM